jgi:hypothetical protein
MVAIVANRLNMFPSSTSTDNISAFQLMYHRHVNATIYCHLEFGAYYQVPNRCMNNSVEVPRTFGALGIAQSNDGSGTCTFLGLHNLRLFKAATFHLLPTPQEVISRLISIAAADKIKISNDPIFQISTLQSPTLDNSLDTTTEISMFLADDNHQDLTLLDATHPGRAPSPPPSTHRADLPLPSAPTQAVADSGGDLQMQADDRQTEQPIDESVAQEKLDTPLTAESSTITRHTPSDISDANELGPTADHHIGSHDCFRWIFLREINHVVATESRHRIGYIVIYTMNKLNFK